MLRLCVLLNQFPLTAFFAKVWIVSSNGTLVKRAVTSYDVRNILQKHGLGLTKTHKERLAMPTLETKLAKSLDEKLKPLSINEYTISDIFQFSEEIQHLRIGDNDFLVSYYVIALFTNVKWNVIDLQHDIIMWTKLGNSEIFALSLMDTVFIILPNFKVFMDYASRPTQHIETQPRPFTTTFPGDADL